MRHLYTGIVRLMALYGTPVWVSALTAQNKARLWWLQKVLAVRADCLILLILLSSKSIYKARVWGPVRLYFTNLNTELDYRREFMRNKLTLRLHFTLITFFYQCLYRKK